MSCMYAKCWQLFISPSHLQDLFESCLLRMEDNGLLHQYLEFREFINVSQVTRNSVQSCLCSCYKPYPVVFSVLEGGGLNLRAIVLSD